ncbi:MAG: ABC transporter ATP-binding protein [Christensenellales bacterium]|jgi:peptide/nickel transport system ATP-binding protein
MAHDQGDLLLEVKDLKVHFQLDEGLLKAVDGVDFQVREGRTLGIVGESGCGKSVTNQALMGIVPHPGKVTGEILLYKKGGKRLDAPLDLVKLPRNGREIRSIRGGDIGMIFQEPMKAFSPVHTIENQLCEGIQIHVADDAKSARGIALKALQDVGMNNPEQRLGEYPHQLSGGMRQRAMIAMALSCNPAILIADEPTTALDVTVQAQVLALMNRLKREFNSAVMFITHDLGVIAEMSDEVAVMYLGRVVEYTDVDTLFHNPKHPYTIALLKSIPSVTRTAKSELEVIEGTVPYPMNLRPGCGFYSRCKERIDGRCNVEDIPLVDIGGGHKVRCVLEEALRN